MENIIRALDLSILQETGIKEIIKVHSEEQKGDSAKTFTKTIEEAGLYLVKGFNTSCEGYDCTLSLSVTGTGTSFTTFANDDVLSSSTSKSRTRILLGYVNIETVGTINLSKTSASGYGISGMYIYKVIPNEVEVNTSADHFDNGNSFVCHYTNSTASLLSEQNWSLKARTINDCYMVVDMYYSGTTSRSITANLLFGQDGSFTSVGNVALTNLKQANGHQRGFITINSSYTDIDQIKLSFNGDISQNYTYDIHIYGNGDDLSGSVQKAFVSSDGYVLLGDKYSAGGNSMVVGANKTSGKVPYSVINPKVWWKFRVGNGNNGSIDSKLTVTATNTITGATQSISPWTGTVAGGGEYIKDGSSTFTGEYDQISASLTYYSGGSNGYLIYYLYCDEGTFVMHG